VYWQPLLEQGLGDEYVVRAPVMPSPDEPHYEPWAARVAELIGAATEPVMMGHSFGASVLLKYLSEESAPPALAGVFLVATPFWGPKFPEFQLRSDFATKLGAVAPLYFYQSRDDEEVPVEHLERYRKALPNAVVRLLDGRGHEFDQPVFPELVTDIRSLRAPLQGKTGKA